MGCITRYNVWFGIVWIALGVSCQPDMATELSISLDRYEVQDGYDLQLIASEPLLEAPVELEFDQRGRMWVVEMPGYMANLDAEGEQDPTGRIVMLSDQNGNGRMDKVQVFLDKLVAPRAICLAYGGLLYAEPPNLWFVEINAKDKPGKRTLVDSTYVLPGNIEHQANGLLLNLDNWIYSANSAKRYRLRNGTWEVEHTAFRGQWGITKDWTGRLYYNNNSRLLLGDRALPQATLQNPFSKPQHTISQQISASQAIFPAHATLMNRGYQAGVLDSLGRVKRTSSACGPLIYQSLMGEVDEAMALVCAPEGNLVARLPLVEQAGIMSSKGAVRQSFLVATDPAFRPVNLTSGPDGAIYVVDMHRGIIQHRAYMTPYLYDQIVWAKLDTILHFGRILRIAPSQYDSEVQVDLVSWSNARLVEALSSPNSWLRAHAQHELVLREDPSVVPLLQQLVKEGSPVGSLHAFWSLEGLEALDEQLMLDVLTQGHLHSKQAVLYTLATDKQWQQTRIASERWEALMQHDDLSLRPYVIMAAIRLQMEPSQWRDHLDSLLQQSDYSEIVQDFVLSGAVTQEQVLLAAGGLPPAYEIALQEAMDEQEKRALDSHPNIPKQTMDVRTHGLALYRQYCSSCHGVDGRGIAALAPSLAKSPYMNGQVETLGLILLYGLQGPLARGNEIYSFSGVMPGFGAHSNISNEDYVALTAYLRNAFGTTVGMITPHVIDSLRQIERPLGALYTDKELQTIHRP